MSGEFIETCGSSSTMKFSSSGTSIILNKRNNVNVIPDPCIKPFVVNSWRGNFDLSGDNKKGLKPHHFCLQSTLVNSGFFVS